MSGLSLLLLIISFILQIDHVRSRNIQVDVKSSNWPRYSISFISEIAEALNDIDPKLLVDFVDILCSRTDIVHKIDANIHHNHTLSNLDSEILAELQVQIVDISENIAPKSMHSLMDTLIGIGAYTPTVKFFQAIAEPYGNPCNGNAFIVIFPNKILCHVPEKIMSVESNDNFVNEESWDHFYYKSGDYTNLPRIILYGVVGSSSFCTLHNDILNNNYDKTYSFRHAFPGMETITNDMRLQGYGVVLDIKNMEYKNVDDRKHDNIENNNSIVEETISFVDGEEIDGLIFSTIYKNRPDLEKELTLLKDDLVNNNNKESMKLWKMKDLGLQTVVAIIKAANNGTANNNIQGLTKFEDIVHNFPMQAPSISSIKFDNFFREQAAFLIQAISSNGIPSNSVFINGIRFDLNGNTFNVYDLLNEVKEEIKYMGKLSNINLNQNKKNEIKDFASVIGKDSNSMLGMENIIRIDVSKGGKYVVNFVNNLEKDKMYKQWPKTLKQLLFPSWNMQLIAKNLYTLIANVDIITIEGSSLVSQLQMIWQQQWPLRIGIVLGVDYKENYNIDRIRVSESISKLYAAAKDIYGLYTANSFLFNIAELITEAYQDTLDTSSSNDIIVELLTSLNEKKIIEIFGSSVLNTYNSKKMKLTKKDIVAFGNEVITENSYSSFITNTTQYLNNRGLQINSFSLNGIVKQSSEISNALMSIIGKEQYIVTTLYQQGIITDSTSSIFNALLKYNGAYPRYHPLLDQVAEYVDITSTESIDFVSKMSFLCPSTSGVNIRNSTLLIVSPTNTGFASIRNALTWLLDHSNEHKMTERHQVSINLFVDSSTTNFNQCQSETECVSIENVRQIGLIAYLLTLQNEYKAITSALDGILNNELIYEIIAKRLSPLLSTDIVSIIQSLVLHDDSLHSFISDVAVSSKIIISTLSSSATNNKNGEKMKIINGVLDNHYVIYNSRLISVSSSETISELDYHLFSSLEYSRIGLILNGIVENTQITSMDYLSINSYIGLYSSSTTRRYNIPSLLSQLYDSDESIINQFVFSVEPRSNEYMIETNDIGVNIHYIINPLSLAGQRAATLMQLIRENLKLHQTITLAAEPELTEFPLQNFYRYVLSAHNQDKAVATFKMLPKQHILTTRIDAPEPWNIQASVSTQDIDNLMCDNTMCGDTAGSVNTQITYKLKNILAAGQCFQVLYSGKQMNPPNGLQLVLTLDNANRSVSTDTLVMQNLGYFQLQANPGLWKLSLAEGRATELYDIDSSYNIGRTEGEQYIAIKSFTDTLNKLVVRKKSGMDNIPLLQDSESDIKKGSKSKVWSTFTSMLSGVSDSNSKNETIHVFSLATGHMYERLLRIMMLSVTKRTSAPVKFWLFENYLSPSFKASAAAMAKHYNFEVGYVTYKWPEWLTQQTQKQRIIWGYKILFLDVLFPLSVKKVIYVDADQVVRADLKELWELDLNGKPYGYVPFCDSRKETLGFQFWRQGYWNDHLRGKPYHISALYVVDLQKFRYSLIHININNFISSDDT